MLSDFQIEQIYQQVVEHHSKYLEQHGVQLPSLKDSKGDYTRDALVLVYLAQNYPQTKSVSKRELTDFIRHFYPNTADVQQARHLGMQKGWYIVSGTRHNADLEPGKYQLLSLEKPYPAFRSQRRVGIPYADFEALLSQYGFRCATCGAKEGEPMYQYPSVITKLMEAHIDPQKPPVAGNTIPQCQMCNRAYRNWWVFDNRGRVVAMSNPEVILRSSKEVQLKVYYLLRKKFETGGEA